MPKRRELRNLIADLRLATVGSGELNARIICAVLAPEGAYVRQSRINGAWCVYSGSDPRSGRPRVWSPPVSIQAPSGSIDDAVRLVREALPDHRVHLNISMGGRREVGASLSTDPDSASAHLMPPQHAGLDLSYRMEGGLRTAATAPIAIVLALLEALITQLRDQD